MLPDSVIPLPHVLQLAVSMTPDPSQLPGGQVLQKLTDGLGGWALALSLVGLLIGPRPGRSEPTARTTSSRTAVGRRYSSPASPPC